ncbi:MAG: Neelaredoxin [Elusimicrobia bacterium GWC2_51_8]|nr:MAG: Neelaredoxin [Elusimicrobia bacterium GWA2_51_34]OGR63651.1 MAG: Neelaredoxin [Elusimicrobia bacterium GWC2_51_8]OGR84587.1 MAG: Neelaredoxin [Elusimicrobia bacterium GWF2_52_66]HAF96328.1 Neelaredoxin [Elusimicrobiota bacterium]HCE98514.1 Neelaredoxin [Elusimicrobiota bacterium]
MADLKNLLQNADWKTEKHTPAIDAPDTVKKGKMFQVTATVGKEVAHPNTTPHHIRWIMLYFKPADDKFPYQIGNFEFTAHGESAQGPDTSGVYTHHEVTVSLKTDKPGIIYALSYCNIHGLWHSSREIKIG